MNMFNESVLSTESRRYLAKRAPARRQQPWIRFDRCFDFRVVRGRQSGSIVSRGSLRGTGWKKRAIGGSTKRSRSRPGKALDGIFGAAASELPTPMRMAQPRQIDTIARMVPANILYLPVRPSGNR